MVRRAIPAEVTNGQFRFHESIADLEGRRVLLVVMDEEESQLKPSKSLPRLTPEPMTAEELVPEQDVDFERPFRRKRITATVRDGGRLPPTLILPEEYVDE